MGIKIFRKNYLDLDYNDVTITITDAVATDNGQDFVDFLRNRNNTSGWMTTGSTDAANTQVDIDLGQVKDFTDIILIKHNFKNYTIQYYDPIGLAWTNFSTSISVSNNATETTSYSFTQVSARLIRLIITGAMVANADKSLCQFILTQQLGELAAQPQIDPVIDKSRKTTKYLSGKSYIAKSVQSFEVKLSQDSVTLDADLTLLETMYDSFEGFLVWLCGGTVTQYKTLRQGYRLEDLYLMNMSKEYRPRWQDGYYANGIPIDAQLVEII